MYSDPHPSSFLLAPFPQQRVRRRPQPRLQYNACGALRHLLVEAPRDFSISSQIFPTRPAAESGGALPPLSRGDGSGRHHRPGSSHERERPRATMTKSGMRVSASNPALQQRYSSVRDGAQRRLHNAAKETGGAPPRQTLRPVATHTGSLSRRHEELADVKPAARENIMVQALALTVRSMREHPKKPLVQEYGCGTMYNIVLSTPAMCGAVCEEGGVQMALDAMRAHPLATGTQLNACSLLKVLSENGKGLGLLEQGGARALFTAAISNHMYNRELVEMAQLALKYMPAAQEGGGA